MKIPANICVHENLASFHFHCHRVKIIIFYRFQYPNFKDLVLFSAHALSFRGQQCYASREAKELFAFILSCCFVWEGALKRQAKNSVKPKDKECWKRRAFLVKNRTPLRENNGVCEHYTKDFSNFCIGKQFSNLANHSVQKALRKNIFDTLS